MATYIVGVYHQRLHSGIQTTPYARYIEGINGSHTHPGTGTAKPISNELKLKLDFMPFIERTVQRYGVAIDLIWYYHDVLRKWVCSYDLPGARYKSLRKFAFKRDPRDISAIYFYDPEIGDYFCIPYRNATHPVITIWEYKRILRDLKSRGIRPVNEEMIFDTYSRLITLEQKATGSTAAARRRRNAARKEQAVKNSIRNQFTDNQEDQPIVVSYDPNIKYLPFEDLEHDPFNRHKPG